MRFSRLSIALTTLFISIALGQSQAVSQNTKAVLTNSDVVQMVKAGLSSELIIAKIKTSSAKFDTSPSVLADLKQDGVSESILVAMVQASAPVATPPPAAPDSHLESARSALKALRRLASATEVGISYVNYSPLVAEVKTEVEDSSTRIRNGSLRASIQASLGEYEYAAFVWQATWRDDFISGPLKDVAVKKYGVQKKGWLKVVWRADFINAIWREARNQFEISNSILSQTEAAIPAAGDSQNERDDLLGAWRIVMTGSNGQSVEFSLTIVNGTEGYRGTLRSTMGNSNNVHITKIGSSFTLDTSEQEKKQTVSIQFEGTVDSNRMKGNATLGVGKQTATLPFTGTKLVN